MTKSALQAHVLANIDRVVPLEPKARSTTPRRRYQLDGRECTAQITGLLVLKLISATPDDRFTAFQAKRPKKRDVVERQPPLTGTIAAIRAGISTPLHSRFGGIRKIAP